MLWVKETFINDVIFVTLTEIYWGHRKYPNQATKTCSVQQNVYFDLTGLPTAHLHLCDYDENRLLELTLRHLYWVMVIDTFVIIKVFNIINYRESYLRRLKLSEADFVNFKFVSLDHISNTQLLETDMRAILKCIHIHFGKF